MTIMTKSSIQNAAATTGFGMGLMVYPTVAGAFVAGTASAPLLGITAIIAAGIAASSYAAVTGIAATQEYHSQDILEAIGEVDSPLSETDTSA